MKPLEKVPRLASAGAAAVTSLLLLWWALRSGNIMWIIPAVVTAVGVATGAVVYGLKWLKKRKGGAPAPGAAPGAEDGEARRARIEELRNSFRRGLKRFLPFRKDLYSVPWYLVVGETGAGKTEAIRHSSLGFPPGLQDEAQGVGGTTSLDWWFTNQAVILDTAGEWIFGEGDEEAPGEWTELFRLLKSHRPRTPLNGLVLTISAESLLTDSQDQMKSKAGKIARRLSQVQRMLDIRFPVFVMVAKSDMIVGFREFFEKTGPSEQNQMLGWSNPAGIDEIFDPAALDEHLRVVLADLGRRRLELLAAPPARREDAAEGEDPMAALYAFPENLKLIFPGLRTYLESIFLLGEWSAKPLFLRGVFFTSSMRQGPPVDVQARDMFGAPARAPAGGAEEEGDRAYFLHDLFAEKVFQEKGLIFSASSAKSHRRISRALLWGFGLAGVLLLIFLTWLSSYRLRDEVGVEQAYWEAAARSSHWKREAGCLAWNPVLRLSAGGSEYAEGEVLPVEDRTYTSGAFLGRIAERVEEPMDLPWTFRFTAELQGNLSRRRLAAARALFESSVLCPLHRTAVAKMNRLGTDHWTPEASAALVELLRLEVQKIGGRVGEELLGLDALFLFVLEEDAYRRYAREDSATFAAALERLYAGRNSGSWPPPTLAVGGGGARGAVKAGVESFEAYWVGQMEPRTTSRYFSRISALTEAGEDFLRAEKKLAALGQAAELDPEPPATLAAHNMATGEWERQFEILHDARERIRRDEDRLEGGLLGKTYEKSSTDALDGAKKIFEELRSVMKPVTEADQKNPPAGADFLAGLDAALAARLKVLLGGFKGGGVREKIESLDASLFAPVGELLGEGTTQRVYEARYRLYAMGYQELTRRPRTPGIFGLKEAMAAEEADLKLTGEVIRKRAKVLMTVPFMKEAASASLHACALAGRWRGFVQVKAALDQMRDTPDGIGELAKRAAAALEPPARPRVPFTAVQGGSFAPEYSAAAAAQILGSREAVAAALRPAGGAAKALERGELRDEFERVGARLDGYFAAYMKYWIDVVDGDLRVRPEKDLLEQLPALRPWEVNDGIGRLLKTADGALTGFETAGHPELTRRVAAIRAGIKAGREQVQSQNFADKCKKVLAAWGAILTGPGDARSALLATDAGRFKDEYLVSSGRDDLAVGYWMDLSIMALTRMGDEFQKSAAGNFRDMALLKRFPLARPGIGSLSARQALEARLTFDKLRADPTLLPEASLGAGGKTGIAALDAAAQRLASYEAPKPDRDWFTAAGRVLAGLPANEKGLECEIFILPAADQGASPGGDAAAGRGGALQVWRLLAVRQGTRRIGPARTEQREEHSLGKVLYPGDEIGFELFKFPDGEPHRTVKLPAPWAALALLHQFGAERSAESKLEWTVELAAKDDLGYERALRLKLKFARALPALKDWPTAR
jgi:hypothetical protein